MAISFKGAHFPRDVILHAVFYCLRYSVSYRDLEETLTERRVSVDHATLNRWIVKCAPLVADRARRKKLCCDRSRRMDETYVRVKGEWVYLHRVVKKMLKGFGYPIPIEVVRRKFLNNIIEQDRRSIKRRIRPMLGFKSFESATATFDGIEVAQMIRKGQFGLGICPFKQFPEPAI